jgi:uncharacterized protein (TIGR03790 family)
MKTLTYTLAYVLFAAHVMDAQTATYHDVAVIINTNSAVSDSIGTYFAAQRRIPAENIIRISAPVTEEIDSLQFQQLRTQVEAYLLTSGLADSINYLVTTKGVPLKVKRSDLFFSSSVEGELSLILGRFAYTIGGSGRCTSPYYRQRTDFTRAQYGIYLVTRLDGYTLSDVKRLIDKGAVIPDSIPAVGNVVMDMDPSWNQAAGYLNSRMRTAADTLRNRSFSVMVDSTLLYVTGQQQVNGYVGWGSNHKNAPLYGRLNFTWNSGAIAETYVSTSGRTFTSPAVYGQSLIADIIAEGVTAAKGYVYEPYASAMADVSILFDLYSAGYTVAESYYSASPFLSWMDVVIGDPKFRLISSRLPSDGINDNNIDVAGILPVELVSFTASVNGRSVELVWKTASEMNNHGFEIEKLSNSKIIKSQNSVWQKIGFVEGNGTTNAPKAYSFTDNSENVGQYMYRLKQFDRDGKFEYSKVIEATVAQTVTDYVLDQNYPNPFNPSTTIRYQMPNSAVVSLKIYDMLGKEVAALVNGICPAGENVVEFNAFNLPSGLYFYTLRSGNFSHTRKMLLVK